MLGDPTAGGPVDAAGIPLARRDYPVTLPRIGDPVKSSAKPERGGELRIYNYADYLNPAVLKAFGKRERRQASASRRSRRSTRRSRSSAPAAWSSTSSSRRRTSSRGSSAASCIQPLNFELVPNLQKNVWPETASPFYDVGPRYSVPYVVYTTGIGWRNDIVDFDPARAATGLGRALGRASSTAARSSCSTTRARRSAWRSCAAAASTSTPRTPTLIDAAVERARAARRRRRA